MVCSKAYCNILGNLISNNVKAIGSSYITNANRLQLFRELDSDPSLEALKAAGLLHYVTSFKVPKFSLIVFSLVTI